MCVCVCVCVCVGARACARARAHVRVGSFGIDVQGPVAPKGFQREAFRGSWGLYVLQLVPTLNPKPSALDPKPENLNPLPLEFGPGDVGSRALARCRVKQKL